MAWTEGQKEMSNQILPILLEVSDQINLLRLNSIHDFEEVIIKLAKATARTQWTK